MDVGLVCDQCDAFNAMAATACVSCGSVLSLGVRRKSQAPGVLTGSQSAIPAGPAPTRQSGSHAGAAGSGELAIVEKTQSKGSPLASRLCKECGNPVAPGYRFCGSCGAPVVEKRQASDRRTQYFGAMQQARAKLVLIKG